MRKKDKDRGYPIYSVHDLLSMDDSGEQWIVRNVVPTAGRVVAYGSGGAYKSAIMFDLSVAVASGGSLMDQIPVETYGPTLVISTEGTIGTMRRRMLSHMRARNVVPDAVKLYLGRRPLFLDVEEEFDMFMKLIQNFRPAMVVIDPYASFLSTNENDTEEAKKLTRAIDEVIEEYECAVVIIHHANKGGDIRGSSVLQGWADSVLKFTTKRKQQIPGMEGWHDILTVEVEKQRDGPMGTAFSAVPFIDEQLQMTSFGVYYGMDAKMVTTTKLKHDVLKLLRGTGGAFTTHELSQHFHTGRDKLEIVIAWLTRDKLIQEVLVARSTGNDRYRHVKAWASSSIGSRVDAARAIFRAEKLLLEDQHARYEEPN